MNRALTALFLAPLPVSVCFMGWFAVLGYPFMLVVVLAAALPLFYQLRKLRWLQWWHALLAGALCGGLGMVIDAALLRAVDVDRLVNDVNVACVGLGALTGFVYWWMGIFRNPAFPFIPRAFPWAALLVIPLTAAGTLAHHALQPTFHTGRVEAVLAEPSTDPTAGQASVRLTTGQIVQADLRNTWQGQTLTGHCFFVEQRWSMLRARRVYELASALGGSEVSNVNDCEQRLRPFP